MEAISLFDSPVPTTRIRAKMNVNGFKDVGSSIRFELGAVYSSRPDSENKSFSDATPSAYLSMDISKKCPAATAEFMRPGAQVYVDISLADVPEWNWMADRMPELGRKLELRVGTLDGKSVTGTYIRESDEEWAKIGRNYDYPKLKLDDDERFNLYERSGSTVSAYWKYVE